ncbi:hypothetical protein [Saccharopolyspora hattusasensis]|uniref:hypothetical protein n=1 Tax=Saccharopolyspora hattusasensis TaxID=1128679 RepID=UPI003D978D2A
MSRNISIVGIDPSLTGTGVAELVLSPRDTWDVFRWHCPTKGTRRDSLDMRCARIAQITADVMSWSDGADLVVIEGPAYASTVGSLLDRYGLWWRVVHRLLLQDVPVAVCPPTVLKKFITGDGRAHKDTVMASVNALWAPDVPVINDNEADALGLATVGAAGLGLPMPIGFEMPRVDAMFLGVEWPEDFQAVRDAVA